VIFLGKKNLGRGGRGTFSTSFLERRTWRGEETLPVNVGGVETLREIAGRALEGGGVKRRRPAHVLSWTSTWRKRVPTVEGGRASLFEKNGSVSQGGEVRRTGILHNL